MRDSDFLRSVTKDLDAALRDTTAKAEQEPKVDKIKIQSITR